MNNVVFTRQSDEWETPDTLFESLNTIFNFTLDAASSDDNFKLPKHYTINDDGLSKSWEGERVFCNPPYSQVKKWVKKSYDERNKAEVIVLLIPARTDTKWFHDYVIGKSQIYFCKGRLKFKGAKYNAPFPSMLCVYRGGGEIGDR